MSHLNLNDPTEKLTQIRIAGMHLFGPAPLPGPDLCQ